MLDSLAKKRKTKESCRELTSAREIWNLGNCRQFRVARRVLQRWTVRHRDPVSVCRPVSRFTLSNTLFPRLFPPLSFRLPRLLDHTFHWDGSQLSRERQGL